MPPSADRSIALTGVTHFDRKLGDLSRYTELKCVIPDYLQGLCKPYLSFSPRLDQDAIRQYKTGFSIQSITRWQNNLHPHESTPQKVFDRISPDNLDKNLGLPYKELNLNQLANLDELAKP